MLNIRDALQDEVEMYNNMIENIEDEKNEYNNKI